MSSKRYTNIPGDLWISHESPLDLVHSSRWYRAADIHAQALHKRITDTWCRLDSTDDVVHKNGEDRENHAGFSGDISTTVINRYIPSEPAYRVCTLPIAKTTGYKIRAGAAGLYGTYVRC